MKTIKGDISLDTDERFNIFKEPGKHRQYKGVDVTLGRKSYDGIFHYWFYFKHDDKDYGFLYKTEGTNPELTKIAYIAAKSVINKLTVGKQNARDTVR